jgi:hypothetical protein
MISQKKKSGKFSPKYIDRLAYLLFTKHSFWLIHISDNTECTQVFRINRCIENFSLIAKV